MLVKRITIFFILGIFFGVFAFYFTNQFSPFNVSKIQDYADEHEIPDEEVLTNELKTLIDEGEILDYLSSNAYIAFVMTLLSFFFLLSAIHLTIDKLFFKKFYEPASMFDALRRSLIVVVVLGILVYLNLYGADALTMAGVGVIAILIEVFTFWYLRSGIYKKLVRIRNKS